MGEQILERIDAWLAAGLIDATTAERLRAAENEFPAGPEARPDNPMRAASAMFGPPISIMELFAYVGAGFLLAAWHVLAPNTDYTESTNIVGQSIRWIVPAIAFAVIGMLARGGSPQLGRAAGVSFAIATIHAYGLFDRIIGPGYVDSGAIVVAGLTLAVAATFRRLHPAVTTQLTLVGTALFLATVIFRWLTAELFGPDSYQRSDSEASASALLTIGWWLAWAVGLGLLARLEWRVGDDAPPSSNPDEEARARRARVTRLIAGLAAVFGATAGAMVSNSNGRALPAWLGDLDILFVSGVLLAIAIRFGALAYLLPAALGFIVALTDLNSQYVMERTGIGTALVLEGGILIATGFVAERLRRMMAGRRMPPSDAPPTMPSHTGPPEPAPAESAPAES